MIRAFRAADLAAAVALFAASVHGLAAGHYDALQRRAWAPVCPDLDACRQRLGGLRTLIAELCGQHAGFVSFGADGHIDLLYVSPHLARCGVASALLRAAESELATAGVTRLRTESSRVARPFFERHGFRIEAEERVTRNGTVLERYAMTKCLDASPAQMPATGGTG